MEVMIVFGFCANCGTAICFNPIHVPSIKVDGTKEPICKSCFYKWNEIHRVDKGLEPLMIHPMAYEPHEEG